MKYKDLTLSAILLILATSMTLAQSSITLTPTDDAYTQAGTSANQNFGSDPQLIVKSCSKINLRRFAFLKFDVSGIQGHITQATLRLNGYAEIAAGSTIALSTAGNDWSESTLTWNTQPASITTLTNAQVALKPAQWVSWDVSRALTNLAASQNTITFMLWQDDNSQKRVFFSSKEGSNPPQLVITTKATSGNGNGNNGGSGGGSGNSGVTRLLYAVNTAGANKGAVNVYSMDAGHALIKTIPTVSGVGDIRGACANASTGRLYVSYNGSNGARIYCLNLTSEVIEWDKGFSPGVDRLSVSHDGAELFVPTNESIFGCPYINVVDAMTGNVLRHVNVDTRSHDLLVGASGTIFLSVKDAATKWLYEIDPQTFQITHSAAFSGFLGPYSVDSTDTYAVVDVHGLWGFGVTNLKTGAVNEIHFPGAAHNPTNLIHGISFKPDQTEVWSSAGKGNPVEYVYDMSNPLSPVLTHTLAIGPSGSHWNTFSIKGDYAYIAPYKGSSDVVRVFDTGTYKQVATLQASEDMIEVDQDGSGTIVSVGDQFGIGRK